MLNLFDMLNQSQNGQGIDQLARQFGLSQQQAQQAVEALMPAFSQGLKRNTSDPYGIAAFMSALANSQNAKYFDNPQAAFTPQGMAEGNDILGQLFGSKDLSRAVAAQAAQATGIGQDVLKQMLPVIASMVMGGLFKQSTNQLGAQAGGFGGGSNPLGEIIEQMMRQGGGLGGGAAQPRQAPQNPLDNPFGKILQDMFGGGAQQPQSGQAPNPMGDNPFGKMLEDMLGGGAQQPQAQPRQAPNPMGDNPWGKILQDMLGGAQSPQASPQEPDPAPQPRANPSGRPSNPYDDIFGKMFETGAKQREDYQKGVESIFEQFKKGMDRGR
ncbi:DUF937 domain-containing protein [Mesorhizobium sp. IMUNJ 23232]|uniref:DUF937 domain-containing protein n=1 Tax=Mesorhizobium sp. IMUNJ 23232 TaxID=3376064 RepID=UPI00378CB552